MMWPFTTTYPTVTPQSLASQTFDYIVVGGGTAGCVLASRMSEDPGINVLLVERGGVVNSWMSRVPLLSVDYRPTSAPVYKWESAPLAALDNIRLNMVSGKLMGGTSKINGHLYTRSTPGEYNAWTESGRKGWSWTDVEPYFNKSENSLTHGGTGHRGTKGPWQNQRLEPVFFRCIENTIAASSDLGLPYLIEHNDPTGPAVGCVRVDATIDTSGHRQSTFDAFLPLDVAVRRARNLFICPLTVVVKIATEKVGGSVKATGVYIKPDGESGKKNDAVYVAANREVILASGAIATPQILLLSGIGPQEHLKSLGVPIVRDLPGVGLHLQDHLGVSVIYKAPKDDTLHCVENPLRAVREFLAYLFTGRGLFLSPNPQITLFALSRLMDDDSRTSRERDDDYDCHLSKNIPDIEIMPIPYNASDWSFKLQRDEGCLSYLCVVLRPESSGTVRLASADPYERPLCDLGTLTKPADYAIVRKAIRLALAMGRKMREMGYPLRDLHVPVSEDDADLDTFIRHGARTTYHYSSSCRMAPEADMGVVDDELRVHGIEGLRIADCSIFPTIPATHLQAPAVMLAERCAAFLKESSKVAGSST